MSQTRVPEKISEFNTYINNTDTFLQAISSGSTTNWERLGLSSINAGEWNTRRIYWRDTLYPKYIDPLQSTTAVKETVRIFMEDFKEFAQPQLNIMAAGPNATSDDELVFNFKIGRAAATHPTEPIAETVVFTVKPLGGGELRFTCRTATDSSRASIPEGADSVQVAFQIMDKDTKPEGEGEGSLPNPDDGSMRRELFTKAQFTFEAGMANVGRLMVIYTRWYNTKHPKLAGPWSNVTAAVIA